MDKASDACALVLVTENRTLVESTCVLDLIYGARCEITRALLWTQDFEVSVFEEVNSDVVSVEPMQSSQVK